MKKATKAHEKAIKNIEAQKEAEESSSDEADPENL